eukprot:Pgem_evm1s8626
MIRKAAALETNFVISHKSNDEENCDADTYFVHSDRFEIYKAAYYMYFVQQNIGSLQNMVIKNDQSNTLSCEESNDANGLVWLSIGCLQKLLVFDVNFRINSHCKTI